MLVGVMTAQIHVQGIIYARKDHVEKASPDPASRAVFVEATAVCAVPLADSLPRAYVRFRSGD